MARSERDTAAEAASELKVEQSDDEEVVAGEVLDQMPPDAQKAVLTLAASMYMHRGPLPDPETLAAYDAIHPGATRELLNGARDNRRHRHKMENKIATTARLSLILTFILMLGVLALAGVLALNDQPWLAALFGTAGIGGIVASMITGGGNWTGKAP